MRHKNNFECTKPKEAEVDSYMCAKCYKKFYNKLKIFKLGYSWGGFDSLITFPRLSKRTFKNEVKGNLIRVYCGLENSQDQINDILNALKVLK